MSDMTLPDITEQQLTPEEKTKVNDIKKLIDLDDAASILQFGLSAQSTISDLADTILSNVKNKNTGHVGRILSELMTKIRELHVDDLSGKERGFLSRLPFVGTAVDSAKKFMSRYQSLSTQIVSIIEALDKARVELVNDIQTLDQFYERNLEYFREISLYILGGESRLKEIQEQILPAMKRSTEESKDPAGHQKFNDAFQYAGRLEKKIHDLKLSRTVALQTGPQIRLVQHSNQELAEKIQSSILNTIPLWKHQIVIAITLLKQKEAAGLQKDVSEATKELLEKNAEMLKIGSTEIAREVERGIVDVETLKKVNADLISTIEDTLRIQHQGKIKREKAEQELRSIEKVLKERILDVSGSSSNP